MARENNFFLLAAAAVAAGLLLLASLDWLYEYNRFLRIAVMICGFYICVGAYAIGERWVTLTSIAAIVIFNPFFPLRLERDQWAFFNLAGAVVFAVNWYLIRRREIA